MSHEPTDIGDPRLNSEQLAAAIAWIREKANGGASCPLCGTSDWTAADTLAAAISYRDGGFYADKGFPMLMLVCKNCGYVRFISAVIAGLVERGERGNDG